MDHNYAIENHVAEGYVLDDLDEAERDAYEEHYFGCTTCAEEVELVSEFMDTAKQVIREELKPKPVVISVSSAASWFRRLTAPIMQPLPAALGALVVVLAGFNLYQNQVTIPQARQMGTGAQPQQVATAQLVTRKPFVLSTTRRGEQDVVSVPGDKPVLLQFDIPPEDFALYRVDITTESGNKKFSDSVTSSDAMNPVQISVPSKALQPGKYFVVIQGVNSSGTGSGVKGEAVSLPFKVK